MPSAERLLEAVTPLYERNDPAHELARALPVTALAQQIGQKEGGDLRVVLPSALCNELDAEVIRAGGAFEAQVGAWA